MNLLFFGKYLYLGNFFSLLFHQRVQNELDVLDKLNRDLLICFSIIAATLDCVIVEQSQVTQVQLSIVTHC